MCYRIWEGGTQSANVLKDKTFYFEKANWKILLKRSHKYFSLTQGEVSQLKRVNFDVNGGKNVPLFVENVIFDENF